MRFKEATKSNMAESDDEVGLVDVKVSYYSKRLLSYFRLKISVELY